MQEPLCLLPVLSVVSSWTGEGIPEWWSWGNLECSPGLCKWRFLTWARPNAALNILSWGRKLLLFLH